MTASAVRRNVFTISPGAPFLATFVDAFLGGEVISSLSRDSAPLDFARATIYVPTQRAGRALAAEFARAFDKRASLLPRILPLGGLDEQENFALFDNSAAAFDEANARPIDELERRLLLAQLVLRWARAVGRAIISIDENGAPVLDDKEPLLVATSPANAVALAADLGALIDEFIIEGVAPDVIHRLADESFDQYWAITTTFLRIALEDWPAILAERGRIDAATRQKNLIETQIASLARQPPGPVIALGSTGAHPTTARLLAAIAANELGAVVLPGLDMSLDEDAWTRVGGAITERDEPAFTHPQAMLKRLLAIMETRREEVRELGRAPPALCARDAFASQALRPADATRTWRAYRAAQGDDFAAALDGVAVIEAPDERLEALALALFMREALETPGRTAALVTPDRNIARRVAAELERFDIAVDDSGGKPLAATAIGALARLVAAMGVEGVSAVNVATLLAHPLVRLGFSRGRLDDLAPLVEIGLLRFIAVSADGWAPSIAAARDNAHAPHAYPAARGISDEAWREIETLMTRIDRAFAPFAALPADAPLSAFAAAHRVCLEAITTNADEATDEGAATLFDLFERLEHAEAPSGFDRSSYASLFDRIAHETILRGPRRAHPRLKILGPLEARLIEADLVLLAGLDEGVWPPQTDTGAFLNRSMRAQLGLSPPERRIGQSAHDFVMALGAARVVLSRAVKRDGSPTVASRFLARLAALAGEAFEPCRARGARMLAVAAALDRPLETQTISRPAPQPPVELRPTRLSVTRIERLRRDPYAIFAEYVLALPPLAPLGAQAGPREIGTAIHEALAQFVAGRPQGALPAQARAELHTLARDGLAIFFHDPAFATFVWPRIEAGLDHALAFEAERRALGGLIFVETAGKWRVPLVDGSEFLVTAVADRIEVDRTGQAHVFDYKTGKPPTMKQVEAGWSPQLTLEAAMIEAGAFADVGARAVASAAYVALAGGGDTRWLHGEKKSLSDIVDDHRTQLVAMLNDFRDARTRYSSRPYVAFVSGVSDYDHLARVKEWSRGGGGEE